MRVLLTTVAALGATLSLGVAPATAGAQSSGWGQLPLPATGSLQSISAVGDSTVFGYTERKCGWPTDPRTCRQHWQLKNGAWSTFALPTALGTSRVAVAATSADDVWFLEGGYSVSGLAYHWDGRQFVDRSPRVKAYHLTDAAAVSPSSVWTVGTYNTGYDHRNDQAAVGRWDGTGWTVTKLPAVAGKSTTLSSVSASSSHDVWASGDQCSLAETGIAACRPYVVHWDGTTWSQVDVPDFAPNGTSNTKVISRGGEVWVGGKEAGPGDARADRIFTLRRDGQTWTRSYLPVNASADGWYSYLSGFAFHGTELFAGVSRTKNEGVVRWNGQAWEQYAGPLATTSTVTALTTAPDGRLLVAGNGSDATGARDFLAYLPAPAPSAR